jgi:hypothetical protein
LADRSAREVGGVRAGPKAQRLRWRRP